VKPNIKTSILTGLLLALIMSLGLVGNGMAVKEKTKSSKLPMAPNFQLEDINGKTVSLSDYRGKVVLVNFWATWCPPCRMEIPHFIALQNEYKDKGFVILGLAGDDEGIKVVKPFAEKNRINYPILLQDNKVADDFGGIVGIPTSFLIDTQGKIVKKYFGYTETAVIKKDMESLLPVQKKDKTNTKSVPQAKK